MKIREPINPHANVFVTDIRTSRFMHIIIIIIVSYTVHLSPASKRAHDVIDDSRTDTFYGQQ